MRIGLFHSTLPEPGRKIGGVEQFVHRLGNALVGAGHDVTVATFADAPEDAAYLTQRIGDSSVAERRARRLFEGPILLQRATFHDRDVLHLHGDDWFFLRRSLPTVRTFHGSALHEARHATSARRCLVQSLVYPAEILSSRLATASYAVGPGMPKGYRLAGVLPLGFDAARLETARSSRPSVLFVGTWEGRKRGAWLASCFREVRREIPDAELWLVSDRAEASPGVEWIRFPSDDELQALYARAWVFCLPSTYEGFGMPYLEAMTQGTPVVATPNAGATQALAHGGGVIVSDGDVESAIVGLLRDASARARLGAEGVRGARRYAWSRCVAAHEKAYGDAIRRWGCRS